MSVTGTWEEETAVWEVIQNDTPLYQGDVVRVNFQLSGIWFLQLYDLDSVDKKLESNPDFEVLNHSLPDENNMMFWTVRVRHDPPSSQAAGILPVVAVCAAVIVVAICSAFVLGMTIHHKGSVRLIQAKIAAKEAGVELAETTIGGQAIQIALAAVAVIVAWAWLKGK